MGKSSPSKPKKPEPTLEEKELARQGVEKWNRYVNQYAPLEQDLVGASDRPTKGLRRGRGNADLMQEASQDAMKSLASPNVSTGLATLGKMNAALSSAGGANALQSRLEGQEYRDKQTLGAIKTGLGVAGESQSALSSLGRQQNQLALDRYSTEYRADLQQDMANHEAMMGLVQMGGQAYFGGKAKAAQSNRLGKAVYQSRYGDRGDFMGRVDGSSQLARY